MARGVRLVSSSHVLGIFSHVLGAMAWTRQGGGLWAIGFGVWPWLATCYGRCAQVREYIDAILTASSRSLLSAWCCRHHTSMLLSPLASGLGSFVLSCCRVVGGQDAGLVAVDDAVEDAEETAGDVEGGEGAGGQGVEVLRCHADKVQGGVGGCSAD
jgi:hypothetical protein